MRNWIDEIEAKTRQTSLEVLGDVTDGASGDFIKSLEGLDLNGCELRVEQRGSGEVKINWIAAHKRNVGNGSRLLGEICKLADSYGINLKLQPFADDERTLKFLKKWYRSFGFRTKGLDGLMYRSVKS